MAVSGQVAAEIGQDGRGKASIVNAKRVEAPEWKGIASYVKQSNKVVSKPVSPKKVSPVKSHGPLSLSIMKSKYNVRTAGDLSEEVLLNDIIP